MNEIVILRLEQLNYKKKNGCYSNNPILPKDNMKKGFEALEYIKRLNNFF
jgi:hypothetical protein